VNVFDQILEDSQTGYEQQVAIIVGRLGLRFGDELGALSKDALPQPLMAAIAASDMPAGLKLVYAEDIGKLGWWADLRLSDREEGQLGALIRQAIFETAAELPRACAPPDAEARWSHTILAGWFVNRLHSPTRGVFDYALALAKDPRNRRIDILHAGPFTPDLEAFARERFGHLRERVRFISKEQTPSFLTDALDAGPATTHVWCESVTDIHITLFALFGPVVMFTCGDAAPTQYADVYWYAHDAAYIRGLWARRDAPPGFAANYVRAQASPFSRVPVACRRDRTSLGFAPDDTVIVTAGNRLGVEMDQAFVDGLASMVMEHPKLRWLIVGGLQEYWLGAFRQVLGAKFAHVPHDMDLTGLFAATDIYANPFRAGGGNTAIMAVDAGTTVLTLDAKGDVGAFVPAAHRAASVEDYFERLDSLVADPALRAAWTVEQQALLATRLDADLFARELGTMCDLALVRYGARGHLPLEVLLDQPQGSALRVG
jgi:hypothetical protein